MIEAITALWAAGGEVSSEAWSLLLRNSQSG